MAKLNRQDIISRIFTTTDPVVALVGAAVLALSFTGWTPTEDQLDLAVYVISALMTVGGTSRYVHEKKSAKALESDKDAASDDAAVPEEVTSEEG